MTIGERLATEGALGRFAVDFVVKRDGPGRWSAYAIELNLRKGGTTHPFLTLQFLTDGSYDGASGRFLLPGGEQRHLVTTDHFESNELRALAVEDLFDVVARHGLHFDQSRQSGVVFHMISSLTEHGRIGLTAVGQSPEEAMRIYEDAQHVLSPRRRRHGWKVRCQVERFRAAHLVCRLRIEPESRTALLLPPWRPTGRQ
jgi:PGM1 C-terminal domain